MGTVLGLSSCVTGSKKTVTPPTPVIANTKPAEPPPASSEPLSTPQTQVHLPPAQPLDPAALNTGPPQEPQNGSRPPAGPRRATTPTPPVPTPVVPAPTLPPAVPTEAPHVQIQEMISPTEQKRLQDQLNARRRDIAQILDRVSRRRLTHTQENVVKSIRTFLTLSEEAEKRNDIRQADALAERAQILARDLSNGK